MKKILFLLALAGVVHLFSCTSADKTTVSTGTNELKQKHFSNEQIQADALALADIRCIWEVAKYNADLKKDDRKLQLEEEELAKLKASFEQKMKIRYLQIEDLKKKFENELEKAHKQLSACQKLDQIHQMQEELEKPKVENQ